jgi:hypothetical protein
MSVSKLRGPASDALDESCALDESSALDESTPGVPGAESIVDVVASSGVDASSGLPGAAFDPELLQANVVDAARRVSGRAKGSFMDGLLQAHERVARAFEVSTCEPRRMDERQRKRSRAEHAPTHFAPVITMNARA